MEDNSKMPLPLEPIKSNKVEDRRLWVGNLDLRITEYQLLKLVQKHGTIEKFDLLFHRSGCPQAGQPRGYAFVTYKTASDAEQAKEALHNLKIGAKNIIVRWANTVNESEMDKSRPKIDIPALAGAKKEDKRISRETAIQAIEAKLKMMKESEEEFELNKPLEGVPIIKQYQKVDNLKPSTSLRCNHTSVSRHHSHHKKPYTRHKLKR